MNKEMQKKLRLGLLRVRARVKQEQPQSDEPEVKPKPLTISKGKRKVNTRPRDMPGPSYILKRMYPGSNLAKLARDTGMRYNSLYMILVGKRGGRMENMESIAFHLGTTLDILVAEIKKLKRLRAEAIQKREEKHNAGKAK